MCLFTFCSVIFKTYFFQTFPVNFATNLQTYSHFEHYPIQGNYTCPTHTYIHGGEMSRPLPLAPHHRSTFHDTTQLFHIPRGLLLADSGVCCRQLSRVPESCGLMELPSASRGPQSAHLCRFVWQLDRHNMAECHECQ